MVSVFRSIYLITLIDHTSFEHNIFLLGDISFVFCRFFNLALTYRHKIATMKSTN